MKKLLLTLVLSISLLAANAFKKPTDEGMWLPILLKDYNYEQMKKLGLKLKPEQIYNVNKGSLKDAIVWFGGYCTGEIVSNTGLILTNHHCGYGSIQSHSTVEDNILDNGFWAKSLDQEKSNPGLFASILVRMEDVSKQIMPALMGLDDKQKAAKLKEISDALEAKATEGTHYEATVKPIFKGNQYIMFVYEKFTDIRLVGTPPQSVGKFGGDTDNWMWPRHTGDFSMFRIYAGKDNKPAAYSEENVPYKPKHSLPVSLDGVKEGDFAMIMGFPGRTNRYETSMGIQLAIDKVNPSIVKLREKRLELMKEQMDKDVAVRIAMSSRYAQVANYWKYFIGQTEQLKRLKVIDQKKSEEEKFLSWAKGKKEYENIFNTLEKAYEEYTPISTHRTYLNEGIFGSISFVMANSFIALEEAIEAEDEKAKEAAMAGIKRRVGYYFSFYHPTTEEKTIAAMLNYFYHDIPKDQHPPILEEIVTANPSANSDMSVVTRQAFEKYADNVMKNSIMNSPEKIEEFLKNPDVEKLNQDPAYQLTKSFMENYKERFADRVQAFNKIDDDAGALLIKGMMEMNPKGNYYPDANSTFRMSYGSVQDYEPKDGVHYKFYTTLDGVEEKHVDGDDEFDAPDKLLKLNKEDDFGVYADKKTGELHTCFITNNDITGGNSGSPVMNGNGQLIGLAFDGNWEAMSGDIYFDTRYKRTINVDVRYVLFLIDKLAGAQNIIKELNLIKNGKTITLYK
jgi:hypothetical protein